MAAAARIVPYLAVAVLVACSSANRGADGQESVAATPRKVTVTATYLQLRASPRRSRSPRPWVR